MNDTKLSLKTQIRLNPFVLCFIMSGVSCLLVAAHCAASCGDEPWPGRQTVSEPSCLWSSSCCEPAQWPGQGSCQCLSPGKQSQQQQQQLLKPSQQFI